MESNSLSADISRKSRLVLVITCLLFGELGVHRFYLGSYIKGLLFILVSVTVIFARLPDEILLIPKMTDLLLAVFGQMLDSKQAPVTQWRTAGYEIDLFGLVCAFIILSGIQLFL